MYEGGLTTGDGRGVCHVCHVGREDGTAVGGRTVRRPAAGRCGGRRRNGGGAVVPGVPHAQQNDAMASTSRIRPGVGDHPARTRLVAAVAAAATVGAALGLRSVATGDVAKYGGDALYTVLVLALVVLVAPRVTPLKAAAVALAVSWGVEFLQLSGVPAELSRHSTAARLVLGSTFNAPDLFWYAVGAAAGWSVLSLRATRRPCSTADRS
ncbi:hypothetical protein GCM10010247_53760 [Streptomyces calvus]|nr:hypothetical protein GCM10010247_53760 [Streptomyces calvus]